jgi:hypothetical protein
VRATAIPNAALRLVERAGHNPHVEQTGEVVQAVAEFSARQFEATMHWSTRVSSLSPPSSVSTRPPQQ